MVSGPDQRVGAEATVYTPSETNGNLAFCLHEKDFPPMIFEPDMTIPGMAETIRRLLATGHARIVGDQTTPKTGEFCVYVFASCLRGPVKIGMTKNAKARLRTLTTIGGRQLKCFGSHIVSDVKTARAIESAVHKALNPHRRTGEWFAVTPRQALKALFEIAYADALPAETQKAAAPFGDGGS